MALGHLTHAAPGPVARDVQLARDFALPKADPRYPSQQSFDDFAFVTREPRAAGAVLASLADSPMKKTLEAFAPPPGPQIDGMVVVTHEETPCEMLVRLTTEAHAQQQNVAPDLVLTLQAM